jgi:hypothetical protein
MPVVAGGIIDEDHCRTERRFESGEGALQSVDIAQVAGLEVDLGALSLQLLRERAAPLRVDVDETDPGALCHERTDDLRSYARCAAGDEDHGLLQARIEGKGYGTAPAEIR